MDELERVRELLDEVEGPGRAWVEDTRESLMARADEELAAPDAGADAAGDTDAGGGFSGVTPPDTAFGDRRWMEPRRALAVAAVAALIAAAGIAVATALRGSTPPTRLAEPAPTATTGPGITAEGPGVRNTPAPGTPAGPLLAGGQACSSPSGDYTVRYPADWHTNQGDVAPTCRVFDPEPVDLEEAAGGTPQSAVSFRVVPTAFDRVVPPGREARQLRSTTTTVSGHRAVSQLLESTGEAALPEGLRFYQYAVDLGDRTLLAIAYETGAGSFEQRRRVLDRMMDSLELG